MAKVFGFTGEISAGKTTAARMVHEVSGVKDGIHLEFSDTVISVARTWMGRIAIDTSSLDRTSMNEGLREAVFDTFGLSLDVDRLDRFSLNELNDYLAFRTDISLDSIDISVESKDIHRPLLQWIGHEFTAKYDANFWSNSIASAIRRSQDVGLITVGGVRYDSNAVMVRESGGKIISILRPGHGTVEPQSHRSERGINASLIDSYIDNSGTLNDLRASIDDLWRKP